jgi:hypothetical protein
MHFLSTGRDDRVRRWIAGQYPERSLAPGETGVGRWLDSLESVHRKDHDAIVDMDWELEELERQIALTTFEHGREHGPMSMLSVDSTKGGLDVAPTEQASQLTDESLETQVEVEHDASAEAFPRTFDRRREGRIMSQVSSNTLMVTRSLMSFLTALRTSALSGGWSHPAASVPPTLSHCATAYQHR